MANEIQAIRSAHLQPITASVTEQRSRLHRVAQLEVDLKKAKEAPALVARLIAELNRLNATEAQAERPWGRVR